MKTTVRSKLRSRKRGAAMVEAAVVMPVVVMFFGLITFAYRDLSTKQEVMLTSRHKAFQNSLQSCPNGSTGAGGGFAEQVGNASSSGGEQGQVAIQQGGLLSVFMQVFSASSKTEQKTATNSPSSSIVRSRERASTSYVYCNPEGFYLRETLAKIAKSLLGMAGKLIGF